MKPAYALFLDRCGLTIGAAAEFHGRPIGTVKAWARGARPVPDDALNELRDLYKAIERASRAIPTPALPEGAQDAARGLAEIRAYPVEDKPARKKSRSITKL